MKGRLMTSRLLLPVLLVIGAAPWPAELHGRAAGQPRTSDAIAIERAIAAGWEALGAQDLERFRALSSPEWRLFTALGNRMDAAQLFAVHSKAIRQFRVQMADLRISVSGDSAWATYAATMAATSDGKPWGGDFLITSIFERRGGAWLWAHTHESKKPTPAVTPSPGAPHAQPTGPRAFPGAEGYGAFTPGGRGGKVYLVTSLEDYGKGDEPIPGTFRAGVEAGGRRLVLFRVAGRIALKAPITIKSPYLTIAGQTAPGDGVTLTGNSVFVQTHDVIVRYLRVRPGGEVPGSEHDGLAAWNAENVIFDHCSSTWSTDENLSATQDSRNITIQWSLIAEGLKDHSMGSLLVTQRGGMSVHHNIYASNNSRNPKASGYPGFPGPTADIRNNVIYNWGTGSGYSGRDEDHVVINYVGNYLKPGPSTPPASRGTGFLPGSPQTRMYVEGNYRHGEPRDHRDVWRVIDPQRGVTRLAAPAMVPPVSTDDVHRAYVRVLEEAGATLPVRDRIDARIVQGIRDDTGRIISRISEVGGWITHPPAPAPPDTDLDGMPDEWERKYRLSPADSADGSRDSDGDGYTNVEEFLNGTHPGEADTR